MNTAIFASYTTLTTLGGGTEKGWIAKKVRRSFLFRYRKERKQGLRIPELLIFPHSPPNLSYSCPFRASIAAADMEFYSHFRFTSLFKVHVHLILSGSGCESLSFYLPTIELALTSSFDLLVLVCWSKEVRECFLKHCAFLRRVPGMVGK
jgi:hypothetical protein